MALTKVSGSILKDPLNLGEVSIGGTLTYEDVTNVDSIGIITARSSIDAQGIISLAESIVHTGDTNTKISFPANDEISLDTTGHDRIYIKSDGKIGMGTVTPAVAIHHFSDGNNGNTLRLENREGYVSFTNDADILSVDANSHYFRNRAGSSVYLVIGTSGQFGLGGTNYGTSGQVLTSQGSGSAVTWSTITGTTINSNADNRVITGSDTANTLNGESNLTFDGSTLAVTGAITASTSITATNNLTTNGNFIVSGTNPNIFLTDTNNDSDFRISNSNGVLEFRDTSNTATRFQIASDGKIDVGGSNRTGNAARLTITHTNNSGVGLIDIDSYGSATLQIRSNWSGSTINGMPNETFGFGTPHAYPLVFTTSGAERLRIAANGVITLGSPTNTVLKAEVCNAVSGHQFISQCSDNNNGFEVYQKHGSTTTRNTFAVYANTGSGASKQEQFRVRGDGKLYKGGNQIYPLVNYSEYANYGAATVTSNSYTDLRTLLSGYTPKKAGNLIVIHHQSQCWQGGNANSSGDAMWRIQRQEGGGSWTTLIENNRIMGNMDGRNYTGGSGLARHHRTVHLMGSFECAGTSINFKSQGLVDFTSPGLQWYHQSMNIFQIWEYEKG